MIPAVSVVMAVFNGARFLPETTETDLEGLTVTLSLKKA